MKYNFLAKPEVKRINFKALYCLLVSIFMAANINAETYYLDPMEGNISNEGSEESPWGSLEEVIMSGYIRSQKWSIPYTEASTLETVNAAGPIMAGDTLILKTGYHGYVKIHQYVNDETIFIKAAKGEKPLLSGLHVRSSSNWYFGGLSISPSHIPPQENISIDPKGIVFFESHSFQGPSENIFFKGNKVFTEQDIKEWSISEWVTSAQSGIYSSGNFVRLVDNEVKNVSFGIKILGNNSHVKGNRILNFSGDGIRALGDDSIYEENFIANAFNVDGNHDDGIQSWSRDGNPVKNVIIRKNEIYSNYNHPNAALEATLQGIGCFDGIYENWTIENNIVVVNHVHGITLMGARNSRIVNNTIVDADQNDVTRLVPSIRVTPTKGGLYSEKVDIINNIVRVVVVQPALDFNVRNNVESLDYDSIFENVSAHNYTLREGSPAIGAGAMSYAPRAEILGEEIKRPPVDAGVDAGAIQSRAITSDLLS